MILQKGLDLIKKYEGFKEKAYYCSAGKITIGYGTAYKYPSNNQPIKETDTITKEQAETELIIFCEKYIEPMIKKCNDKLKENGSCFTKNQICSLMSLFYNVGTGSFYNSKCFEAICKNNTNEAMKQWDWGKKQWEQTPTSFAGLKRRRNEEIELFFNVKDYWE